MRFFWVHLLGLSVCMSAAAHTSSAPASPELLFFWGVGCPHCAEAEPFIDRLEREHPEISIERVEIRQNPSGRQRFIQTIEALHIQGAGIPTFVVGDRYVVGFRPGVTEREVESLLGIGAASDEGRVELPWVGEVDPTQLSLPVFTLLIGLLDGVNPCAFWVLLVLLGLLSHTRSRRRLVLYGGTFVLMSGVVYFLFMTAWLNFFHLVGFSRWATLFLGVVVLVMGLINLKELFWFKKGVSLMIPEKAKPGLYRRMRSIEATASLPAAFIGIAGLAFLVNLVELGCTLGLPAIYTRILSLQTDLSGAGRYAYLALYNLAYIVPLAVIVSLYSLTLRRFTLKERGAKVLKLVSGLLLLLFGLLLLFRPGWIQG